MLDFAQYMVIAGENAAQHFPAFARDHILFNKDMRVYSDSTLSRVFSDITKDQIIDFLDSWNEKQDHESRIYVSYDSTNKNTQAGDIDFAEFGHAKDDPKTPIVNIGVGYDTNNRVPLFSQNLGRDGCINHPVLYFAILSARRVPDRSSTTPSAESNRPGNPKAAATSRSRLTTLRSLGVPSLL